MATLKTKYITVDKFKEYFGIDLEAELKRGDNVSDSGIAFLKRIEDRIATFIDAEFFRKVDEEYPDFTDYQKQHYQLALLEQAIYVFKNGDISVDSGYDYDEGVKTPEKAIVEKSIAPNCKQNLMLCGLWTRKIHKTKGSRFLW